MTHAYVLIICMALNVWIATAAMRVAKSPIRRQRQQEIVAVWQYRKVDDAEFAALEMEMGTLNLEAGRK